MSMNKSEESAFSRDAFLSLKGYMALCVLIHHLYQFTGFLSDTNIGYCLNLLGHWAVVVFVFLSGYGVAFSYCSKGKEYLKQFPKNRLLVIYLTYLLFVLVYAIYETIIGSSVTLWQILHSISYGGTIVSFGWYFQLTILLYLLFFATRHIADDKRFLVVFFLIILGFLALNLILGSQFNVYVPAFSFYVGTVLAHINHAKSPFLFRNPLIGILCGGAIFCLNTIVTTRMVFRMSDLIHSLCIYSIVYMTCMILADTGLIIFVCSANVFVCRYAPKILQNPFSRFVGTYSLEIYAFQGLSLRILYDLIPNRFVYSLLSIGLILILAIPTHYLLDLLKERVRGSRLVG